MNRYTIYAGELRQQNVVARSEEEAITNWLDEQGWESIDEAAEEHSCDHKTFSPCE